MKMMKETPNDGLILFRGYLHRTTYLLLTSPDTLFEVLNTKPYDYHKPAPAKRFLRRVLGNGLINVEGNEHKRQRKSVASAFTGKNIRDLVPIFWSKANHFVTAAAATMDVTTATGSKSRSGTVEINALAQRITLDIIGKACFGRDLNTIVNSDDELAQQYAVILDPGRRQYQTLFFLINAFLPEWLVKIIPWERNQEVIRASQNLRTISRRIIAEKRAAIAEKNVEGVDILSVLMKSRTFDDDGLVDQLLTFLAAGHETTSTAITWASYLLAEHPEVQERLRSELKNHLGEAGWNRPIDASLLDKMDYLAAVCDEILRLYPTIPVTARVVARPEGTFIRDQHIPQGTFIVLSPWIMGRSSQFGVDAGQFRPDRWLKGPKASTGGADSAYSKITFLHGPRSCIGQGFAREELKCLLAALVLRFHIEMANPGEEVVGDGIVTIKPKNGLKLRLTEIP